VRLCRYYYGDDADAPLAHAEPRWQQWLVERFAESEG
jgi:hypothetical protein